MQELTEICEKRLVEEGFPPELMERIKTGLERFRCVFDFEALLTIIQALARGNEGIRSGGPLCAFLASNEKFPSPEKIVLCAKFLVDLARSIRTKLEELSVG